MLVVSDHGDEFFEHGGVLHGRTQYQELVRVPLILRGPGVPRGVRVATTASLVDVLPTILTRSRGGGAERARRVGPRTDVAEWRGRARDALSLSEADHNNAEPDMVRAVRHRQHTLHFDRLSGKSTLFDLGVDPHEQTDIAAAQPEIAADLQLWLERFRGAHGESGGAVTLSPAQLERLHSLGYVH